MSSPAKRSGSDLSPDDYTQLISDLANYPTGDGETVNSLHHFLKIRFLHQRQDNFVTIYDLCPDAHHRHPTLRDIKTPLELQNEPPLTSRQNIRQLVFLKGFPSQQWIKALGSKYQVDPVFFSRHLDFHDQENRSLGRFATPVLPSSSWHIFQFSCMTIATRDRVTQDVQDLRAKVDAGMIQYIRSLKSGQSHEVGDSIVRPCHVVDNETFVLEQQITVCLHLLKSGWIVLIWSDAGKSLHEDRDVASVKPWRTGTHKFSEPLLHFAPIVSHRPMLALKPHLLVGSRRGFANGKCPESIGLLDQHYGRSLRLALMANDPAYALSEVFSLVAASHNQFLNLMHEKLNMHEQNDSYAAFPVLRYLKQILSRHTLQLEEIAMALENTKNRKWPKSPDADARPHAEFMMETFHNDLDYLLKRAKQHHDRSHEAINLLMNSTSIADARDQASETERIGKLTFVAFFYAPLSFATSLFGMNFKEVGEGLSIWIWFAVAVPLLGVTLLAYLLPTKVFLRNERRKAVNRSR
ncbi:uncharacterized protein RHO25_012225 [Cercospora beticola]|uniref:Uncharacterized protein n=1 Tax=Cercospora beticola TaxID=122368 RepID=A0ABZ0P7V3_CERBT|nr:hypothetical protein RHO25_012225 [Cercospora beticola]